MDQWTQGAGEIPERPRDPAVQYPYQQGDTAAIGGFQIATAPPPNGQHKPSRKTRADVREMRRKEREEGVLFHLENSDLDVRVRDLPFTDRIMLKGIPADMRVSIEHAVDLTQTAGGTLGISAALSLMDAEADLSDAVCIAGFIVPRLVRTEPERVNAIAVYGLTDDDVYLVDDLHPDEKAAYRDFVFRDRDGEKGDTARLASFPGAGVAEAPDRQDRPSPQSSTLANTLDGGIGLRTGDAVSA